ncbi:DUF1439 domain-containing protein [Oxalobacteraceae bacterium OM1]|nr:DUF1439 domain-containing protein [Oxalobacteraceae bacterium OM1]
MRHRLAYLAVVPAVLLSACATLLGPRDVDIPLSRLQEALASRFPFQNRYLDLLDISVSNPRLALQPETNRVVTSMDASFAPPFLNQPFKGSLAVSGRLQVDMSRNALVLAEPKVENFAVNGQQVPYANQLAKIGSLVAEQLLQDVPLYTFKPEDFRYGGTRFLPTKITTRSNGLVVTFEPVK